MFSPYYLHRDPDVFPDPQLFDPERCLPGRVTQAQREVFIPFGSGTRKRIGDAYGPTEATPAAGIMSALRLARIQARPIPSRSCA
ncbi:cytochrome P450 [Embleya sp. AB8]|uniref:cytochrome P450 n=1 Tax=Embleya sp. AB8 TaxID=3156304 RepID=UPI003C74B31F